MAKIDVERVITEYYMLKTVLKNKYAMDIVSGKVEPAGPTAAADKRTLQAMQRYVRTLDEVVIPGNGLSKGENLDKFLTRVTRNFKEKEANKPESRRLEYSENPFDDNFKYYVSTLLNTENAKSRIEKAITSHKPTLDSVNSLAINLGGKKQSSYVRLLAESTELFSTVSGLRDEIERLNSSSRTDKSTIDNLRAQLAEKTKEAENYRQLCEKAIEELGQNSGSTVLVAMLKETNSTLENVIRQESKQTRDHITKETDRVLDVMQRKDRIKTHILSNAKTYPRYIAVYQGRELNNKGLKNLHNEIQYAATQLEYSKDDPAVSAIFNELSEQNLKNSMNNSRPKNEAKGKKVVPIVTGILLASLFATTAYFGIANHHLHNDLHEANQKINENQNNNDNTNASDFQKEYEEYVARENAQYDDYSQKLQIALNDGTFVVIDQTGAVTAGDASVNGNNLDTLNALRDKYAADDRADMGWNSTTLMDADTQSAINAEKAEYFQTHYEDMVNQVAQLQAEIADLNSQLDYAHDLISAGSQENGVLLARVQKLEAQVADLQAQIDNLQSIIDAGNGGNSGLQEQINELQEALNQANAKIAELEQENQELTEENQELKEEVAELQSQVSSLEGTVGDLNSKIASLENQNSVLSTDKAALQIEVADLQAEVADLQAQLESLIGTDASQQIQALEEKIDYLEGVIEEANARIDSLQSTNEALTQQIVDLENNINNLESDMDALEDAIDSLENENASLKTEVSNLQKSLGDSMNSYNELLAKYNALANSNVSPEELAALQTELSNAYNLITSYEEQIVELYNGITKENTTTSQAQQDLEQLFKLFGIDYNEKDSPSNDNSEYQR